MNLLDFRQLFKTTSGRYELVNDDGSDNGADFYINAGQRYLDRLIDIPQSIGRVFVDISAGDVLVKFNDCRSILEVWSQGLNDIGEMRRLPLTKYSQQDLRGIDQKTLEEAYTGMYGDLTQDRPLYYTPARLRLITVGGMSGGVGGFMDVLADGHQTYNGIVLLPPSDGDYSIEVVGKFYSATMLVDTDHTYWSDVHSNILLMSAMRQVEIMRRNTEGVKDWDNAIKAEVIGIDMDGVAEDCADVNQMEG